VVDTSAGGPASRGADDELSAVLDPAFVEGLDAVTPAELRVRRDRAVDAETRVSYARRILQGRIDLLRGEILRRAEGDEHELLDRLPRALSDSRGPVDPAKVRLPRVLAPPDAGDVDVDLEDPVALEELDDGELASLVDRHAEHERRLSDLRRRLFAVIDRHQEELAERYRSGTASVSDLLQQD
jgi:hypothetical protein